MARTRKKNKNLQDAKAAASNPGDAGADPPKLCLTILLPKKAKKAVTSPEPEGSQLATETITPPPVLSPKTLKRGVHQYLRSRGHSGSIFMLNSYQSETTPLPKVKIGKPQKDAETPIALPGALVAPTLPTASAANPLMPGLPYGMPPFAPWWMSSYQTPAPPPKSRYDNIPSSDPIEDVEDVTLFPRITPWLQELDNGPRGHDGHNFSQFAAEFEREKYMCVIDLMDLNAGRLTALAPKMAHGTASKLLSYAS
ncbi:hypothetical protein B0H14DRAFT_3513627 [Mycena olivaceomarginata]|nr:hypothetical protein B0H14DRAFT_3513627 [Mycena olivaceomarginata]